jgi:aspartate kinase
MNLVVQKYGGTSVGTLGHIENVAAHVAATVAAQKSVVVTISAMGEQTDELLAMALRLNKKPPRRELDMLLTAGERISAALLAIALDALGVASVSLTGSQCGILTDETHGNARITKITGDRIRDGLGAGKVVIVAGFQGVNPRTKEITTLGRGGTDLTAIAIAAALGAQRCELYKDVRGVFTADPRVVTEARLLPTLSFGAMTALAWGGASVLHPRGAHLAAKFGVEFEVRSSAELASAGTVVRASQKEGTTAVESPKVEALAHRSGMSIVECRSTAAGRSLADALEWLWEQGEAPLVSQQGVDPGGNATLTTLIKTTLVDGYLAAIGAGPGAFALTRRQDGLAAISVVGQGFRQSPETVRAALFALGGAPRLFDASDRVLTVCVPEAALTTTLSSLHRALLPS